MKWIQPIVMVVLLTLALVAGVMSEYSQAEKMPAQDRAPVATGQPGVIEGKIVEVESHTLVLERLDGQTVRVPMPGKSGETAGEFEKGEWVEATVTPEGITTSVRTVANPKEHEMINPEIR
jgi:hypothetical protein